MVIVAGGQLVGREEEFEALVDLLDTPESLPRAAVLAGEAGIGKTTLWLAATETAARCGYGVLTSRPSEAEARYSFAGLADLLGGVLAEVLPQLPGPRRRALESALALSDTEGADVDERVLAFTFLGALRVLAAERPLLLAVDDVQWLDAPSLALLRFALPRLEREPIATVASVRGNPPPWLRQAAREERLLVLELRGLSIGALRELLRARLEVVLARPVLRRISETSGGNPFFALELTRALQRRGGMLAPGEQLPLPADLDQLLQERLDGLSASALAVARVVASLAEPTVPLVEATAGATAEDGLADALESRILELDGERLRFTHPLLGSAITSRSPPAQRRALHAGLAILVPDAEERARHLALSASGPDPAVAAALDEAARRARSRGAPAAAAELAEQALRLTPPADEEEVHRRTIDAAEHVHAAGDGARAIALLETALERWPPGPARAAILRRLAYVRANTTGLNDGIALYRQALEESGGADGLEAEIHLELANWLLYVTGMRDAEPHARAAVRAAERSDDPGLLCQALAMLVYVEQGLGRGIDDDVLMRALELEESLDRPIGIMSAKAGLYELLLWSHDLDRARAVAEDVRDALHRRDEPYEMDVLVFLALIEWRAGNWDRAAEHADSAWALHQETGRSGMVPLVAMARVVVSAHRGQLDLACLVAEDALARAERAGIGVAISWHRWILGFVELSLGNHEAALRHLRPASEGREAAAFLEPCRQYEVPDLLDALVASGALDEAEDALTLLEERARALDRAWALAIAARGRALVHAARGDLERALTTFEAALAEHERAPDPFQHARTLLALGATQRRAKQRGAARTTLERALSTLEQLPAPLWAEKARAELARISGRAPSRGALTPSEERVAALVAEGRTNREVAAALFVTEHTVEAALTRVYGKLGVRSRAELAGRLRHKS